LKVALPTLPVNLSEKGCTVKSFSKGDPLCTWPGYSQAKGKRQKAKGNAPDLPEQAATAFHQVHIKTAINFLYVAVD
jgi:hypothetical protein